jgi:hypothetical protein
VACRQISTNDLDIALFENVADVAATAEFHAGIIPRYSARYGLSPFVCVNGRVMRSAE